MLRIQIKRHLIGVEKMKRINTATAVNGMFVDGNRDLGQKATKLSADWCSPLQLIRIQQLV